MDEIKFRMWQTDYDSAKIVGLHERTTSKHIESLALPVVCWSTGGLLFEMFLVRTVQLRLLDAEIVVGSGREGIL